MKKICIVGLGYVGLVSVCCFADIGYEVIGTDIDKTKIDKLKNGECTFYEPKLEELLIKGLKNKKIIFNNDVENAIKDAEIIFICVGTPTGKNGKADLSQIKHVSKLIGSNMDGYKLIVEKSTVPVNTSNIIRATINKILNLRKENFSYDIASNPEFLREGQAVDDFLYPERIIIGVDNEISKNKLMDLYSSFECPIIVSNIATAEISKYAANSYLATKISYINMISELCEKVNANVDTVALAMGIDSRIGSKFLEAGIGFGGSCFPKDLLSFRDTLNKFSVDSGFLNEVIKINDRRINHIIEKSKSRIGSLKDLKVAVLGLSFKANTDDIRCSQAIKLIEHLIKEGCNISCYDSKAITNAQEYFNTKEVYIKFCKNVYDALEDVDLIYITTEWDEFKNLDFNKVKKISNNALVFDTKNLFTKEYILKYELDYMSIGRGSSVDEVELLESDSLNNIVC